MLNTLIVGATGYAGAELAAYLNRHPHMNITGLTVSAQSADAGKLLSDLHPQLIFPLLPQTYPAPQPKPAIRLIAEYFISKLFFGF